ncbi:methionine--tRNA ligase [Candidatus Tisiphia endosymbiont of Myopa tessellatipennis]|uniref:methionine--tRNA ligase n=1 Tax=Candidatus Tisiphia endosymbiont of Myopa tessellatipennis TaxID=3066257 RepID=UPI00313BA962
MKNTYYITTPIYYVNDIPHIGHAYTSVASDVIARFMRLSGKEVMFLTGTDEHGQKVEKSAIAQNVEPQIFTDTVSETFRILMHSMNISNDDFIRTTEARHKQAVSSIWQKLLDSGNIYLDSYKGWYSTRDEAFYDESELTEDGLAPTKAPVEWLEEPSYFFALSKWQDKLLDFYDANPDFIRPSTRRNEVISFVKSGLHDLSISRSSFKWGIKVPNDEKHVIYVWLDALTNYISALGYPNDTSQYNKFWPADVHIVGKDILRFHAVYWSAFLMAASLSLPKCVMAHGWWTNEGQKISKSIGNVIDPLQLIKEFGLDPVRYYLMREVIFGSDGNYSRSSLINRVNSELSNKIGNLLQRTLAFVYNNNEAKIPSISKESIDSIYESFLMKLSHQIISENSLFTKTFAINSVLENIITLTEEANIYIDREAPWQLKKTDPIRMNEVLYTLLETLRYIAVMLQPFIPDSANKMLDQLGVPKSQRMFKHLTKEFILIPGSNISQPKPIFPRFQDNTR